MNALELLRFSWSPSQLRLLLVALADPGPAARRVWVGRAGVPRNHLAAILGEVKRLGGAAVEEGPEGIAIRVQPAVFWRVTPLMEADEWARCWQGVVQERLQLRTEMPSLAESMQAMAVCGSVPGHAPGFRVSSCPESGSLHPESGSPVKRLNGSDLLTFNVERLRDPDSGSNGGGMRRDGWIEPETEQEAMAACLEMFGGLEEMRVWGGRWRNRWRANPDGLRKVLNMVREDRAVGRQPSKGGTWGRFANYLWRKFVDRVEVAQ